jgi:hypothetical protein
MKQNADKLVTEQLKSNSAMIPLPTKNPYLIVRFLQGIPASIYRLIRIKWNPNFEKFTETLQTDFTLQKSSVATQCITISVENVSTLKKTTISHLLPLNFKNFPT